MLSRFYSSHYRESRNLPRNGTVLSFLGRICKNCYMSSIFCDILRTKPSSCSLHENLIWTHDAHRACTFLNFTCPTKNIQARKKNIGIPFNAISVLKSLLAKSLRLSLHKNYFINWLDNWYVGSFGKKENDPEFLHVRRASTFAIFTCQLLILPGVGLPGFVGDCSWWPFWFNV
jgi:hypothetical protein